MAGLHEKLQAIYEEVGQRNAGEQEFHQAVYEVLTSLGPVVAKHPEYADGAIIRRPVSYTHLTLPTNREV